ncbi:DUF3560 domain-containing protein [Photobacterium damselae]|uniref:DUF3560 domain-containing protein n=1 Tax=Photobacterium damselae TaxID=38293 RepID=UPI000A2FB59D|nr:DUF3560 domain-containing protein [Photobacterium damselae]ARR51936.1 ltrC-like protein [Photobacterium damselae subsp. damselae]
MTYSNVNHATISNQLEATKGVALGAQGSNKNEILKSLKAGKLRKNAKNKITQLLAVATKIEFQTQSMEIDDSWNANEPRSMSVEEFWAWYEAEYSDMNIRVECKNGIVSRVRFSDCIYHFSNDVILTFSEVAEKEVISEIVEPSKEIKLATIDDYQDRITETKEVSQKIRLTYQQVKQALLDGYISPLNSTEKRPTPPEDNDKSRKVVSLGDYQKRLESKRDRLEARAEKASQQSDSYFQASKNLASMIPFGQPILVGHHSEARARRHADKIYNDMGKSVKAAEKAKYLEQRAQAVGTAGIASDDPEAIQKLKNKLESLEKAQEMMKAANKIVKSQHMSQEDKIDYLIQTLSLTHSQASEILKPDFCGRVGFASYQLSNNNANIRQTRERLNQLEVMHNQEPLNGEGEIEGLKWTLYEEEGRIKFSFDDKPSDEVRSQLKLNGFKWSRYGKAWVRKLTPNAILSTHNILKTWKKGA